MQARILLFSLFLLCVSALASAQTPGFSKDFMAGEAALLKKDYKKAIRLFEKVLAQKPELHAARRYVGVCYEMMGDYPKALEQYELILERDSMFSRTVYYRAAQASHKAGEADKALKYYGQFELMLGRPIEDFNGVTETEIADEPNMVAQLDRDIRACLITIDSTNFLNLGEVENLGAGINSRYHDYFPFISNDQKLMFFTSLKEGGDEDLYYSTSINGEWRDAVPVGKSFNTPNDEGMATFVRDGKTLYFIGCDRVAAKSPCDIWEAHLDGFEFMDIAQMKGKINSDFWDSQACISCDGSTIYFASRRPGGLGGQDIWKSHRLGDGSWSEPVNMGAPINTPGDEESPFIANDGETFFFSSDRHIGLGDQDIFMTRMDRRGNWSNPVNLGSKINSPHRELGFFLSADGKTGYFASDRPAGFGGMDIYSFELSKELYSEPMTFVEGFVIDSLLEKPIKATVKIKGREDIQTDENGRFFVCVHAYELLPISVEKQLFLPYQNDFAIPLWNNKTFYKIEIRLQPVQLPPSLAVKNPTAKEVNDEPETTKKPKRHDYLQTIFFEFDKAQMSTNEVNSLNGFLQRLKNKNIQRVEIIGFSDDVGTDMYNLKLSEERAKQIALYLKENGILVDRIYIEGKGEIKDDKPKNLNRKVDIKVTVLE
ncbi:MAG: OmpA family protein [Saprospiraceae bacterium]